MHYKVTPLVVAIGLLGIISLPAHATQNINNPYASTKVDSLLNQNQGGTGLSANELCNWLKAVTVSGKINVDFLASNKTTVEIEKPISGLYIYEPPTIDVDRYHGKHSNDLQLTDAAIFFDVAVNNWTKAHLSANFRPEANFSHNISDDDTDLVTRDFDLPIIDEAHITIADFAQSPFYARIGRQYATFGHYDVYAIVPSLTQLMSESNQIMALAGYQDSNSFNANVYTFRGADKVTDTKRIRIQNYGATFGFGDVNTMGYHIDLGYLDNLADVAYINDYLGNHYYRRVHGLSADAAFQTGPFDVSIKYVTALNRFDLYDIPKDTDYNEGAKPWAAGIDVGYGFNTMAHQSRFGLSYQQSGEAVCIGDAGAPEMRYQAEYTVNVSKNANLGFVVYRDKDYRVRDGGTNESNTTGVVRFGVDLV